MVQAQHYFDLDQRRPIERNNTLHDAWFSFEEIGSVDGIDEVTPATNRVVVATPVPSGTGDVTAAIRTV